MQNGIDEAGVGDKAPPLRDSFEVKQGNFGISLFSKRAFAPQDLMAYIPSSRLISDTEWMFASTEDGLSNATKIALWFVRERHAGKESPFAPYIDVLPTEVNVMRPIHWPEHL